MSGAQQTITDYMAMKKAFDEKKKEMDVIKDHMKTLESSIIALMKKYERNSIVVGDQELRLTFDKKEKNASKEDRKARVLQLCGNNMQNANRIWEAAHAKDGYEINEYLDLMSCAQPFHQRASISEFK